MDLRTLKTGIGVRDRHMRDNYLEVGKGPDFDTATIEGIQIEKLEGKTTFNGTLVLHGERQPISGTATLARQGVAYNVEAEFPVSRVGVQHSQAHLFRRRRPGPDPHQDRTVGDVSDDDRSSPLAVVVTASHVDEAPSSTVLARP